MNSGALQPVHFQDLGPVPYEAAWDYQETLLRRNLDVKAARFSPDGAASGASTRHHLLFCTHPPVYTLGKSGKQEHLLADAARLEAMGATFCKTNRGGDITYHGPGQVVGYPVLDLELFYTDLGRYMRALEEVIIQAIVPYGLRGERLPGSTGVWLDADNPARARKICAMGVRCSRWVTMHGWALNVNTDLRYFDAIVPCGIRDKGVTSLQAELGHAVNEDEVKHRLREAFAAEFGVTLIETPVPEGLLTPAS